MALASPGYPAYRNILRALDVEVAEVPVGPETNFQPTPDLLERIDGRLDGLIIASPSNPTGTMIHRDGLKAIARYCGQRGVRLISDEIYHGITYGEPAETALAFADRAVVINSFSKYYSMTGWRLGWMVVPEELLRPVECLAQNCSSRRRRSRSMPDWRRSGAAPNWTGTSRTMRATANCCCGNYPKRASAAWLRRTVPFTFMPTSPT